MLGMSKVFYIFKEGDLYVKEGTFYFKNVEMFVPIPVEQVLSFELHGGCSVSSGAFSLAGKHNIPIHMFDYYANYMGTYWPKEHYFSGDLTIKQSLVYSDIQKRLELSRILVKGVENNMRAFLGHIEGDSASFLKDSDLIDVKSIQDMMLIEARMRKDYYNRFDAMLPDGFKIDRREIRPPSNYGNSLISFGNTLLYTSIITAARKTSVNITIPFYHEPAAGRFALSLDLSEVFKPGIVDRFLYQIVKQGILQPNQVHFNEVGGGILLNETGKKIFMEHWDKWLEHTIFHKKLKRKVSHRHLLVLEMHKYAKHIEGIEKYDPIKIPDGD